MGAIDAGDGYGYGSGDGYGDGYGYGYGSGYGDGSGSGYGYGSGDGSGSGYGYGSGDGYGDGYGSGYGSGYGYGDKEKYFVALLDPYTKPSCIIAFWRSTHHGEPANGGNGINAIVGNTDAIAGPLKICKHGFHGTLDPDEWKGACWWIVALHEPVQREGNKIASLKRTFLVDLGKCPF